MILQFPNRRHHLYGLWYAADWFFQILRRLKFNGIAGGKALSVAGEYAPRLTDKVMEAMLFNLQKINKPSPASRPDGLYSPLSKLEERGGYPGHVAESSLYTKASLHPLIAGALLVGAGLTLAALLRSNRRQ